jgi:CDP-glucose 4,6-dehydratase
MIDTTFWHGRKVFITGHTGFKGSWLCLWLKHLGAEITGYSLAPPTTPSLFELCKIDAIINSVYADIRDLNKLSRTMRESAPEIVIHMAAQPLVRESYTLPVETYETNVMGTVNILEAVRNSSGIKAVINVTTDKCYENMKWNRGYREDDQLGGFDPYSNSKACSELVTSAYRNSYFNKEPLVNHYVGLATARAGNVIGGGDWAKDRLICDFVKAILEGEKLIIRNPHAIRPWQHVLEPLSGYLTLAEKLYRGRRSYAEAWNFGPEEGDAKTVEWLVERLCEKWGNDATYAIDSKKHPHEAHILKLDCSKAKNKLNWQPRWRLEKAIDSIIEWTKAYQNKKDLKEVCLKQIQEYEETWRSLDEQSGKRITKTRR